MPAKIVKFPAFEVEQPGAKFYIFVAKSSLVRRWCYLSQQRVRSRSGVPGDKGVQRFLDPNRLEELGLYIDGQSASFSNNIIINFESEHVTYDHAQKALFIPEEDNIAWVVDGQYRLFGFEKSKEKRDFPLIVAAFIRAPLAQIAYIFRIINSTQRRLNPSLIYDLLLLSESEEPEESQPAVRASRLVTDLAQDPESALFQKVKLVGRGKGSVTKAAVVRGLIPHLTEPAGILTAPDVREYRKTYEILSSYFLACQSLWGRGWDDDKTSFVAKSSGIFTLLYAFGYVMRDAYASRDWSVSQFKKLLDPLYSVMIFPASEARQYSGNPGNKLLRQIVDSTYKQSLRVE